MTTPRGRSFLTGARWPRAGGTPLVLDREDVIAFADIDAVWPMLADDERLLFLLGYEASRGETSGGFSPDAFVWRCRVVVAEAALAALATTALAAPLALSTTEVAHTAHLARVRQCHELLKDGVLYQANLAHRLDVAAADHDDGLAFFAGSAARDLGCSAFVDVPGFGSLISLSPERFLTADLRAHTATTFPIKGTLPRTRDVAELLASTKDQAEHVMIVDLMRNDLGRVAVAGGVTVESLMHVVTTPSVHHLESTIAARLRDDVGVAALLAACAPGGSITGAPKSSAIEVIADLEDGPRGAYTGVLGVVDNQGRLASSLLIRTWIRPDHGGGSLHVGGGIVVDSDPETEWQETLHKAQAFGPVRMQGS